MPLFSNKVTFWANVNYDVNISIYLREWGHNSTHNMGQGEEEVEIKQKIF